MNQFDKDRYEFYDLDEKKDYNKINDNEDETPTAKESLIGFLLGLGYITVFVYIPYILIIIFFGSPYTELGSTLYSTVAQMLTAVIIIIIMGLVSKRAITIVKHGFTFEAFFSAIGYAVMVYAANIAVNLIDIAIFGSQAETNANQSGITSIMILSPLLCMVFTCIIAPIIEELTFRYYLFKRLSKRSVALAFIVTSVGFALIHMISTISTYAQDGDLSTFLNDLRSAPSYLVAGLIFCYVYHKSKKISVSIFAHMIYNTLATILLFINVSNMPLIINNVSTTENTITFDLRVNEADIKKIELYDYNDSDNLIATIDVTDQTTNLQFNNLQSIKQYSITITYDYQEDQISGTSITKTDTISSWAITR